LSALGVIPGDGTEVRRGNTYEQGGVGEERGGKETNGCPLTHVTNQAHINVHYYFENLYTCKYVHSTPMANHIAAMLDIR
jgi:hypothetical protein